MSDSTYERYADAVAKRFIDGLHDGGLWRRDWNVADVPRAHYNPTTGQPYRGGNQLMLMLSAWARQGDGVDLKGDARWMTYKQARKVGAHVRQGEKAVMLISFKEVPKDEALIAWEQAEGRYDGKDTRLMVKPFFVFHASQIDGLPAPPQAQMREQVEINAECQTLINRLSPNLSWGSYQTPHYLPGKDTICMPEQASFESDGAYYAALMHELGHWSGHKDRLDRNFGGSAGSEAYAKEELRAEIASFMLCQRMGVQYAPEQHTRYVKSWVKILEDAPREILRASADAEKIMTYLGVPEVAYEKLPEVERTAEASQAPEAPEAVEAKPEAVAAKPAVAKPRLSKAKATAARVRGKAKAAGKTRAKPVAKQRTLVKRKELGMSL